jgi:hypothetical protein
MFYRKNSTRNTGLRFRSRRTTLETLEPRCMLSTIPWSGAGDGTSWDDASNWNGGVVPGAEDFAYIPDMTGAPTISITDDRSVANLFSAEALDLSDGSLTVGTQATVHSMTVGDATLAGGVWTIAGGLEVTGTAILDGATLYNNIQVHDGQSLTVQGATVVVGNWSLGTGSSLTVAADETLNVTNLTSLSDVNLATTAGGVLTFSAVTSLTNVDLAATTGGQLSFPAATNYASAAAGNSIDASGSGSQIDLSSLTALVGGTSGYTTLNAADGGELDLGGAISGDTLWSLDSTGGVFGVDDVTSLADAVLDVSGGASLSFDAVTSLTAVDMTASTGGQILFPAATSYTSADAGNIIAANGDGSQLDLSSLTTLVGGTTGHTALNAVAGGAIDLSGAVTGDTMWFLSGIDSNFEVSGVTSFSDTTLVAANGATWVLPLGWTPTLGADVTFSTIDADSGFVNETTLTVSGVTLTIGTSAFANAGELSVVNSGVIDFNGGLDVDDLGIITGDATGLVTVSDNLRGTTTNNSDYAPQSEICFDGDGTEETPQQLEVMGADLGNTASGFDENFAYQTLSLDNGTYLQLVDLSDNATASTAAEAVYVDTLVVPTGTTLDLNGLPLYARTATLAGTVANGSVVLVTAGYLPTVATPASAAPDTVTGTTTALSVLGDDEDTGESSLTYTWTVTSLPLGAGTPTFSANGTNAAKETTATFSAAGTYAFQVTITDPDDLSATDSVSVTVTQTITSIAVSPAAVTLDTGATQQFTATGEDQFGHAMTAMPVPVWDTNVGEINGTGLFTAQNTSAAGTVTATISIGGSTIVGTAEVTVDETVFPATITWTGGGDGTSWTDAANWTENATSTHRTPTATDLVLIVSDATVVTSNAVVVDSLSNHGALVVAESFTVTDVVSNYGDITFGAQDGANLYVGGALLNAVGANLVCAEWTGDSTYATFLTGDIDNQGTLVVHCGYLMVNGTATLGGGEATGNTFVNTGTIELVDGPQCGIAGLAAPDDLGAFEGTGLLSISLVDWNLEGDWTVPFADSVLLVLNQSTVSLDGDLINPAESTFMLLDSTVSADVTNQGILVGVDSVIDGQLTTDVASTLAVGLDAMPCIMDAPEDMTAELTITSGFTNLGTIQLYNFSTGAVLTVAGTLVNAPSGAIASLTGMDAQPGSIAALEAALVNQGTISVEGCDLAINTGEGSTSLTLVNEDESAVFVNEGLTLTIGGAAVTNTDDAGIELADDATLDLAVPTVRFDGASYLWATAASTVHVRGSFLGDTTNVEDFALPGTLLLDGDGTLAAPQQLELMQEDLGNVAAGYDDSRSFNTLLIGEGTCVQLVDLSDNASGADAEAGYTDTLAQDTGSTLIWGSLNLYVASSNTTPEACVTTPTGVHYGDIAISYSLVDAEADPCSIVVEYSTDGGLTWNTATEGLGGDGTSNLASGPDGYIHTFVWASGSDISTLSSVLLRITPSDITDGAAGLSGAFTVDAVEQPTQFVSGSTDVKNIVAGQTFSFAVQYTTSDGNSELVGLGLRIYYDSTALTFVGLSDILDTGYGDLGWQQFADTANDDGDASTDQYILVAWWDLNAAWPGDTLPTDLATITFTLSAAAETGDATKVNFGCQEASPGYAFASQSVTINTVGTNLDITGDGIVDSSDGLVAMRYLFGFRGTALLAGVTTELDAAEIVTHLDEERTGLLDVDGNGMAAALSDGLLIRRYLAGWTGEALVTGALGTGATRTDPGEIVAFLESYVPATSSGSPLLAVDAVLAQDAPSTPAAADTPAAAVTDAELAEIVDAAIDQWAATGLADADLATLRQVKVSVADLPDAQLGWATADRIVIDDDAAGAGWFVDATPAANEEFATNSTGQLVAKDATAARRMDLLTVVAHELGHHLGLDDLGFVTDDLMSGTLAKGIRRLAR